MASILEGMPCRVTIKERNAEQIWTTNEYNATFLDLSTDHEEYENGPGMYPVAIVLLETGQLASVAIQCVQILEPEEQSNVTITEAMGNA